jgi:hypothetical protein
MAMTTTKPQIQEKHPASQTVASDAGSQTATEKEGEP